MSGQDSAGKRAIVIAGPTASGKSALALALAERLNGVVINADSMQVYADLRVLTARPSDADMARVPHRLFGHIDAAEAYSVGRWLEEMRRVLDETWRDGHVPVVVGGTGLYLKALTEGLSDIPEVADDIRARVRDEARGQAPEALHARLRAIDPAMALRLRPSDPQRLIRAIEVIEATGRSLVEFQRRRSPAILPVGNRVALALQPDRPTLNRRIRVRLTEMVEAGLLDEVARLGERDLDHGLPAMRALGVRPLLSISRGEHTIETATDLTAILTSQYAKRQTTFARHQLSAFAPFDRLPDPDELIALWHSASR